MTVDLSQFFQVFFEESAEHLAEMERIFLAMDPDHPDEEDLHAVFRAAHSIKGGAGTFGFADMAGVTHILETLLDRVRNHEIRLTAEMVERFLAAGDAIAMQLAGHRDGAPVDAAAVEAVCDQLNAFVQGSADTAPDTAAPEQQVCSAGEENHWRITYQPPPDLFRRMVRLEPLFEEMDELGEFTVSAAIATPETLEGYDPEQCLISWDMELKSSEGRDAIRDIFMFVADEDEVKIEAIIPPPGEQAPAAAGQPAPVPAEDGLNMGRRTYDRDETAPGAYGRRTNEAAEAASIRVGVSKVDRLINQVGELVITQAMLAQTARQFDPVLHERLHLGLELLERNTRDLQESVMSIRMMPISFIFSRFPRLVHDLAAKLGKQVELKLVGETTELDKGLIEKMADPLTHLVRNSLDHGIEAPERRREAGKSPQGTVTLKASQQGGRVVVEVADDGGGLNRAKILQKARTSGMGVSDDMTDEEVWQLIFAPGFSTADQVTDVSGRGVGMDVVIKNVQTMGGRVTIFSTEGKGTRVIISLPLTLAILDGLSVKVGNEVFIVPLNSIVESLQPRPQDVNVLGGKNQTIRVRGEYLPLLRVGDVFSISDAVASPEAGVAVIVDAEGEQVALLVDELLNQHQVVIKSLEANYRKVDGTAGATILGDGHVALILDVGDLIHLWRRP